MFNNDNYINKIKPQLSSEFDELFFTRDSGENHGVNVDMTDKCGL